MVEYQIGNLHFPVFPSSRTFTDFVLERALHRASGRFTDNRDINNDINNITNRGFQQSFQEKSRDDKATNINGRD